MLHLIAEPPITQPEQRSVDLTEDIIRARAYHYYAERGYEEGHDIEDWYRAEAEIVEETICCC